jgi:hypothetical protein
MGWRWGTGGDEGIGFINCRKDSGRKAIDTRMWRLPVRKAKRWKLVIWVGRCHVCDRGREYCA